MHGSDREKRKKLILELFNDSLYVPMRRRELAIFMQVTDDNRSEFDSIVDELINEGSIECTKRGKLMLKEEPSKGGEGTGKESKNDFTPSSAYKGKIKSKYPVFTGKYVKKMIE